MYIIFGRKREATSFFAGNRQQPVICLCLQAIISGDDNLIFQEHCNLHFTGNVCLFSLLVFYSFLRGFYPRYYSRFFFSLSKNQHFDTFDVTINFFLWLLMVVLLFWDHNWLKTKLATWLKSKSIPYKTKREYQLNFAREGYPVHRFQTWKRWPTRSKFNTFTISPFWAVDGKNWM